MKHLKHFGLLALTLASLSSMIGSGWLFGAWKAARLAGPAAIFAWPNVPLAIFLSLLIALLLYVLLQIAFIGTVSPSAIISYVNGPISAIALRKWKTHRRSPLTIKGLSWISPLAFVVISLVMKRI